jgi:hypothetical protein
MGRETNDVASRVQCSFLASKRRHGEPQIDPESEAAGITETPKSKSSWVDLTELKTHSEDGVNYCN